MTREALLAERLRLVLALGAANSERQRAQARAGGAEIVALHAARTGDASEAEGEEAARAALAEAEARIEALDAELAAVDRALDAP